MRTKRDRKEFPGRRAVHVGLAILFLFAGALLARATTGADASREAELATSPHVVLLHGLGRSSKSNWLLAHRLEDSGFRTHSLDYASTELGPEELVQNLAKDISSCCSGSEVPIHFVTHSLGGIMVRAFIEKHRPENLGRVVMLSPPNQGTELVDRFGDHPWFQRAGGPTGRELGTDASSLPKRLGPANFELGIITGNVSLNPITSWMITGADDGVVAVESARLEGMADFLVVPRSHTFIMNSGKVTKEIVHFLQHGAFSELAKSNWGDEAEPPIH